MRPLLGATLLALAGLFAVGCGDTTVQPPDDVPVTPTDLGADVPDAAPTDAPPADAPPGDGAACTTDQQCDDMTYCNGAERCVGGRCTTGTAPCEDRYACTADTCDEAGRSCTREPDHAMCDDGNACNGRELCDPTTPGAMSGTGCQPVRPDHQIDCDDRNTCTIDACDNRLGCVHSPRDLDGDGRVDRACTLDGTPTGRQGDDCNDSDPRTFPGAPEVCTDNRDNNCNLLVDFADTGFCRATNGSCATAEALAVDGPGNYTRTGSTMGLAPSLAVSCGPSTTPRETAVYTFTLRAPADVAISTDDASTSANVALASACAPLTEMRCARGTSTSPATGPEARYRMLPAGTYFVLVQTTTPRVFRLRLRVGEPTSPPTYDLCPAAGMTPPIDLSDGMSRVVSFGGFFSDYSLSCDAGVPAVDAVYPLTLRARSNVTVRATGFASGNRVTIALSRSPCGVSTSEVPRACASSTSTFSPPAITARDLAPGTYYVTVKNSAGTDTTIQATITDPTMRPRGDACPGIDITPDGPPVVLATTGFDAYADLGTPCGSTTNPMGWTDWVYHFRLTTPRDVTVTMSGPFARMQLRSGSCSAAATPVGPCVAGSTLVQRYRGLGAGDYYLVGETTTTPGFAVTATVTTTEPGVRARGDTCPGLDVTPDGAPGTIDTTPLDNMSDLGTSCGSTRPSTGWTDWVYHFRLTEARDVTLTMVGGTFTRRMQLQRTCAASAPAVSGCETATAPTRTYRGLAAGDYWVVGETTGAPRDSVILIVTTTAPAMRTRGDACSNPAELTLDGSPTVLPLVTYDRVADHGTPCGSNLNATGWTDWVARFRLTERRNVTLTMTGVSSTRLQVQRACGDRAMAVPIGASTCFTSFSTTHAQTFTNLAAGEYFLVGETTGSPSAITITATATAPTP